MKKITNNNLSSLNFRCGISNLFRISDFGFRVCQRGFSLVEMLFYVVILSFALLAILQTLIVITRSYGILKSVQSIEQESALSLERLVREVRNASAIDDAGSTFGTTPGKLLLNSTDISGATRTVEFSVVAEKLSLKENGVVTGVLTSSSTAVTNLVFRKITTTRSKGVKIEMTLTSGSGPSSRTENFYTTAVLRDSY